LIDKYQLQIDNRKQVRREQIMIMFKLHHCGGFKMSKSELSKKIDNKCHAWKQVEKSKSNKLIVLQGNTQINGYLLVIQSLTKKYKNLKVLMVSDNMSVYSY